MPAINKVQHKFIQYKKSKKYKVAVQGKPRKLFCPLCIVKQQIKMTHNEADNSYSCPHCGHIVHPKLGQINLITSQLKASNDPLNTQRAITSKTNMEKRRIEPPQTHTYFYRRKNVFGSLMEADYGTNIYTDEVG